jgi:hypothetical protein
MTLDLRRLARVACPLLSLWLTPAIATAQGQGVAPTRTPPINLSPDPWLAPFRFRSIGPASMGGRIDDIAVSESDPSVIYVGYAVGGVYRSLNNGTTFEPVFQTYGTASIGDIAIHPTNPDIVYVGTGESNNRQTTSFGDGIYKTTDGGKTFSRLGLAETQAIARIVIDPRNPEIVYVASPGHLFGPNPDRGIYKSTDGGKTWSKIKYVDEYTGFTDIAMDPASSSVLYAASYQRLRSGCCFSGGGPGSALWKSQDAGRTWRKLEGNGLPPGTYGRIALGVSRSNPNVVYAQIEAGQSGTAPIAAAAGAAAASSEATPAGPGAVGGGGGGGGGAARGGAARGGGGGGGGGAPRPATGSGRPAASQTAGAQSRRRRRVPLR